ncbi:MAG: hypothetical protein JJV93_03075 [Alphaproteobacteria bacterium]|nr:hypothetical protein [Alphaproteobacteria bacterium]MBL0718210.1 hypothetical protein [Alphaproteobacteria bacterium]
MSSFIKMFKTKLEEFIDTVLTPRGKLSAPRFKFQNVSSSLVSHIFLFLILLMFTTDKTISPQLISQDIILVDIIKDITISQNSNIEKEDNVKQEMTKDGEEEKKIVLEEEKKIERQDEIKKIKLIKEKLIEPEIVETVEEKKITKIKVNRSVGELGKTELSLEDYIRTAVNKCWSRSKLEDDMQDFYITMHISLNEKGTMKSMWFEAIDESDYRKVNIRNQVRRAFIECQPYNLPTDRYQEWMEMNLRFYPLSG